MVVGVVIIIVLLIVFLGYFQYQPCIQTSCSSWSDCNYDGIKTRTCIDSCGGRTTETMVDEWCGFYKSRGSIGFTYNTYCMDLRHPKIVQVSDSLPHSTPTEYINSVLDYMDNIEYDATAILGGPCEPPKKASEVAILGRGCCWSKSLLFCALMRVRGIPCKNNIKIRLTPCPIWHIPCIVFGCSDHIIPHVWMGKELGWKYAETTPSYILEYLYDFYELKGFGPECPSSIFDLVC